MAEMIPRYNEAAIIRDLTRKMVFIAGSRQVGKTTLAKKLIKKAGLPVEPWYLNWDVSADREQIIKENFPAGNGLLALDDECRNKGS